MPVIGVSDEELKGLSFSQALDLLTQGAMIARAGWNGKGMFLFIRPEFECNVLEFHNIKSVPESVKRKISSVILERHVGVPMINVPVKFTPYISMFAADGSIVNGWLASQTDILADDWEIVY